MDGNGVMHGIFILRLHFSFSVQQLFWLSVRTCHFRSVTLPRNSKVQAVMDLLIAANFSKADEVRALIDDLGLMFVGED